MKSLYIFVMMCLLCSSIAVGYNIDPKVGKLTVNFFILLILVINRYEIYQLNEKLKGE